MTNQSIAVVGAGICGMFTGLALSRRGFRVTLFERDVPPPDDSAEHAFFNWQRRGAAQFRHPHAFLGLMCNLLEKNYPDLLQELLDAGARKVGFEEMVPKHLHYQYRPEQGDEQLWVLMCRRATIETVLRRYVDREEGLAIANKTYVTDILVEEAHKGGAKKLKAVGLELTDRQDANAKSEHFAEIIIDATGRAGKFNKWLSAKGAMVTEERDDAEIVYYTRHYSLKPGIEEPQRDSDNPSAGDLGYLKYGVFPGDSGHFALIICIHNEEKELRQAVKDPVLFDAICNSIPGVRPWVSKDSAVATTEPFGIGQIHAVWRDYVHQEGPQLLNFFAVGDAASRTNPLYGRGCSTGTLHAHVLAEVLGEIIDPWERALSFKERTEAEIRPIFNASLTEDKRGIKRANAVRQGVSVDKARSIKKWFALAFGDALMAAAKYQLHVHRGIMRTVNLVEKPGDFLKDPKIRNTIFRYMLRGRKRNAKARIQAGLTRQEMLEMISHLTRQNIKKPPALADLNNEESSPNVGLQA
jgi:2-polyprenyl-6-methoxyphenol hydroxylase-like FAD-dependent oxidoreductase